MATILIVIIYIAFIGLGVPDSLIGSAWPAIHLELGIPVEMVSILTFLISGCTVLSSMFSTRILNKLGTAKVTALSTVIAPPYKFKIPADVLKENNTLKIVVTNTSANWYVNTDYFKKWKTEELSQYFAGEIDYAKDFLSGGLYEPVTICTE